LRRRSAVSRSGSTVTNITCTSWRLRAQLLRAWASRPATPGTRPTQGEAEFQQHHLAAELADSSSLPFEPADRNFGRGARRLEHAGLQAERIGRIGGCGCTGRIGDRPAQRQRWAARIVMFTGIVTGWIDLTKLSST
jgi:hypothetical protein